MFKGHFHDLGQDLQPRTAVVDLDHKEPAWPQNAMALGDNLAVIGGVLHDAVGVDEIEGGVGEWQRFAVSDLQAGLDALLGRILGGQGNRAWGGVHARHAGAGLGEPDHLNPRPAADV
jgi:hypothetical protein